MPSKDTVISVQGVTKDYRIFKNTGDRLKQSLSLGLLKYHRTHTALKNISFTIERGETVGIIGRNGAGKSTLLQLICGILKPTNGVINVNGRISAMLELGAGFNPEFTGRENVYFHGSLLGFTNDEMDERIEDIESFADIGDFIDQPVRTYSSGMFMRLAFAVNIHVEPDILIIDEILAVGDTSFQQKCFNVIYKLQSKGTTILWVSHNPYQIERLCDRAAVLNNGHMSDLKPAKDILGLYHDIMQDEIAPPDSNKIENHRIGTQDMYFEEVFIESTSNENTVYTNQPLMISANVISKYDMNDVRFRFEICSSNNDVVMVVSSIGFSENNSFSNKHKVSFYIEKCQLTSGWYYVNAYVSNRNVRMDTWMRVIDFKVLLKDQLAQALTLDQGMLVCDGNWILN